MQIGRERPDEHGRVPPHRHDVEWDQCTGVGPSGGSSAPQGGWGHSGRHWWLPGLAYGVWGLLHEEEITKNSGLVRRCSGVVGRCGAMGCSVLLWGHLRADSQLPLPARGAGKGSAFGSLFPAAAAPVWSELCLRSWPCCWYLRGQVGSGGPPQDPQVVCGDQLSCWGQVNSLPCS